MEFWEFLIWSLLIKRLACELLSSWFKSLALSFFALLNVGENIEQASIWIRLWDVTCAKYIFPYLTWNTVSWPYHELERSSSLGRDVMHWNVGKLGNWEHSARKVFSLRGREVSEKSITNRKAFLVKLLFDWYEAQISLIIQSDF